MTTILGVYAGVVVSVDDPQNRGRVRLRIPQVTGMAVSGWAESVTGGVVRVGDRVTVAFEGGDANYPLYWPRAVVAWQPLELLAGWKASGQGAPVYRVTQDGMVELAGSVEAAGSIALGAPVLFAQLPQGAYPLEGFHAPAATSYYGAYDARTAYGEWRATTSTDSATYVTDVNGPSVNFIAPASGHVVVLFGTFAQSNTDAGRCIMGVRVLRGSTVIADGDDNRSVEVQGPDNVTGANSRQVTGLTPGDTYTVTALYRTEGAGSTASFDNKWITVIPVGPHDTPAARVQVQNNGLLAATFPSGAAAPYDLSLTGIRVRIV